MTDTTAPTGALPPSAPQRPASAWHSFLDLIASMRFAITLLCVICIASVIGTVVKQNEPINNYINQFGPFWAEVFGHFGLYNVYSAPWFLAILGFLVVSTSLCIARNTPKILADLRTFKEHVREQSLRAFHHHAEGALALTPDAALAQTSAVLAHHGWQAKAQVRDGGTMVAARKGRINKLGYLAAHSAIVLICLGGLLDGNLVVQAQMWLRGVTAFEGGGLISQVGPEHRLPVNNPTFRGNLLVPEGSRAGVAVLSTPHGVVLQELDFDVELKKFIVEFYDTGMPKLFASQIVLHDHATGATREATVKVNEPVFFHGVAIYQSSFDDGGSKVALKALPMRPGVQSFDVKGSIGDSLALKNTNGKDQLALELTSLKVINVENLGDTTGTATDVRTPSFGNTLNHHLGSGVSPEKTKTLHNVGPAITYKLRDASGQAREFHNYMVPVELEGLRVLLAGVRDNPGEPFSYLRIPVDEQGQIDSWLQLREALADPEARVLAAQRYSQRATPADKPEMAAQIQVTGERALALFAGAELPTKDANGPLGGLVSLSRFIEASVPEADRQRVAGVLLRILNGALFELNQLTRERHGHKPLESGEATQRLMTQTVMSLSDSFFYPAPMLFQLTQFDQVQASVFQVARAPGKTLVYLGAVLLILGVFAMLYIREKRLWIWLSPTTPHPDTGAAGTHLLMALSAPRRTLDVDAEFDTLRNALGAPASNASGEPV